MPNGCLQPDTARPRVPRDRFIAILAQLRSALWSGLIAPIVLGLATQLYALDLYWDVTGGAPGASPDGMAIGSWSSSSWTTDPSGSIPTVPWVDYAMAYFSAGNDATGSYVVQFTTPQVVSNIVFEEGNVGIVGPSTLTLTDGEVTVFPGITGTISAPLGGSNGLQKSGDGTLVLNGAFAYSGNTYVAEGTLKLVGGTVNNTGIMHAANEATLELGVNSSSGSVIGGHLSTAGSGVINITNQYKLQDVTLDPGSNIVFASTGALILEGTITNYVTIERAGPACSNYTCIQISGDVTLAGTGSLNLTTSGFNRVVGTGTRVTNGAQHTIQGAGMYSWGSTLDFTNQGLVDANQPGASLDFHRGLINTGTMRASNGGTLAFGKDTITNTGAMIRALDGSTVQIGGLGVGGANPKIVGGTLSTSGSGAIKVMHGGLQDVTLDAGSTLNIAPGGFVALAGTIINHGNFGLGIASGNTQVAIDGNVTVAGTGVWHMTPISNNSITGFDSGPGDVPDVLTNEVLHTIQGTGVIGQFGGLSFINKGLVDANHPSGLAIRGDFATITNLGTMRASNGGSLHYFNSAFTNTGTLEALDGTSVTMNQFNAALLNVSPAGVLSGGTYRSIDAGNGATMAISSATVNTIAPGTTVELSGAAAVMKFASYTNLAASLVNNAGTLKIMNGHQFNLTNPLNNTGILAGNGTVAGSVTSIGLVSPGASPGTLTIAGNYTQTGLGALEIEIGGLAPASHDKLVVTGTIQLGGTLNVSLTGGFMPGTGAAFDILDWGTRSETFFSSINLPPLAGGLAWNTADLYTTGILSVGQPGSHNGDGIIDAADYVAWRKMDGASAGYSTWRAHFGETVVGSAADATVPEPALAALALCAAAFAFRVRH